MHTDIPGYQNLIRMPAPFFGLAEEHVHHCISHKFQEVLRSWTETGNNAETPGNSRELHLLVVSLAEWQKPPSVNLSPRYAEPYIYLLNFRTNICAALLALKSRKGWNVLHAAGAIDVKQM